MRRLRGALAALLAWGPVQGVLAAPVVWVRGRGGRVARTVGYALMALAGAASMVWPAPAVQQATSPTAGVLAYVWAGMLVLGGLTSALGAGTDRWLGEYAGLWPLIAVFAVYGLAAFASDRGRVAVAGGLALLAIALLALARWHDVALIRREADRHVRGKR